MYATSAVHPLSKRNDFRAIKPLLRFLTSKKESDFHIGNIAGRFIAEFQEPGFRALTQLMDDPDVEIRRRVIAGMTDLTFLARDKSLRIKAREVLKRSLVTESDPTLRQWLAGSVKEFSNKNLK